MKACDKFKNLQLECADDEKIISKARRESALQIFHAFLNFVRSDDFRALFFRSASIEK